MNEPTTLGNLIGSSLNAENERARQTAINEKDSKRKRRKRKRKFAHAVWPLRDPDGLDMRDLLGL